ncbi:MAG: hypothetical protein KDA32_13350 [Phycisphaerales bacterium]|nr:hypothetical protein [Phycisphaerales bacterium]
MSCVPGYFRTGVVAVLLVGCAAPITLAQSATRTVGSAVYTPMVVDTQATQTKADAPSIIDSLTENADAQAAWVLLPALDNEALRAADRAAVDPNTVVVASLPGGVGRALGVTLADLADGWTRTETGALIWLARVESPTAYGVKLRFEQAALPPGAELWVWSASAPTQRQVFHGAGPFGHGDFWTTNLEGDAAFVAYVPPADGPAEAPFVISHLTHIYRDIFAPAGPRPFDEFATRVGPCHSDVTCFPAWDPLHNATARVTYIESGDNATTGQMHICCGTLLATAAGDMTPYLYTAQHCCSVQSEAESATVYWFYQTSVCNGVAPSLSTVPQSTYANLINSEPGTTGTDFSLILIEGALPNGLTWAGWDTDNVTADTQVAGIHHPMGSFKRIMFGVRMAGNTFGADFYPIDFQTDGKVEFSTSGSGLYRVSNQAFIGHAYAAVAPGCDSTAGVYGKFRNAYDLISGDLNIGPDDGFENNDNCYVAAPIPDGMNSGLVVKRQDEDWYGVIVNPCDTVTLTLTHNAAWGDIDLGLYLLCDEAPIQESTSAGDSETVSYTNSGTEAVAVLARVHLASDTRNEYGLQVDRITTGACAVCPFDVTGDQSVDLGDLAGLLAAFGYCAGEPAYIAGADFDHSLCIDLSDLAGLLGAFGNTCE